MSSKRIASPPCFGEEEMHLYGNKSGQGSWLEGQSMILSLAAGTHVAIKDNALLLQIRGLEWMKDIRWFWIYSTYKN